MINAAAADEASEATGEASEATTDEEDGTIETSDAEEDAEKEAAQATAASQPGFKSEPDETINDDPTLTIPDVTVSGQTDPPEQPGGNTGVGTSGPAEPPEQHGGHTGVGTTSVLENTGVGTTRKQQLHKMQLRHNKRSYKHWFINQHSRAYVEANKEMALSMIEDIESPFGYIFQTEQMLLKKGLKAFGKPGADAVVEELRQLDYMQVIKPKHCADLSTNDRHKALNYLMYLKQKRCGRIKARGCADGRKTKGLQRKRRNKFTDHEHRGAVPIMCNRCTGGTQGHDRGHTRGIYAFGNG